MIEGKRTALTHDLMQKSAAYANPNSGSFMGTVDTGRQQGSANVLWS